MPSCWICLDEGPDDEGKPLVRDCSCRGDSGYVHLGCLVSYATRTSDAAAVDAKAQPGAFAKPWRECPCCHQRYQNEVALDVSDAFIAYARERHDDRSEPSRTMDLAEAYKVKVASITMRGPQALMENPHLAKEAKLHINRMLSLAEGLKKNMNMKDSWARLPENSDKNRFYKRIRLGFEAFGYVQLWMCTALEGTDPALKEAEKYNKRAIVTYRICGAEEQAEALERATAVTEKALEAGIPNFPAGASLTRAQHETICRIHGADSEVGIWASVFLAEALTDTHQRIEAEQIAIRAVAKSRRVLGPGHNCTKEAEDILQRCRERRDDKVSLGGLTRPFRLASFANCLKRTMNPGRPDGAPFADPGVPSSHALLAVFIATTWHSTGLLDFEAPPPLRASIWLGAAAVSWLRVARGYHTWAQVAVGAGLGGLLGQLWVALSRIFPAATFYISLVLYLTGEAYFVSTKMKEWVTN